MRLTAKLVSALLVIVAVSLATNAYITVRKAAEFFEADMKRQAALTGKALGDLTEEVWRLSGKEHALEMLDQANARRPHMEIRWVWLDTPAGSPDAAVAPENVQDDIAQGREVFFRGRDGNGDERLYTYVPVEFDQGPSGALELSQALDPLTENVRSTLTRTSVLAGIIFLLSGAIILGLGAALVGRPLSRLTEKTRRIGGGDLSHPLPIRGRDEISELGKSLNVMCGQLAEAQDRVRAETNARIAAIEQMRHGDRLKTVGRLASGVAHELGTPLNIILGRAQQNIRGDLPSPEAAECSRIIVSQAERITNTIQQLLDFSRQRSLKRSPVDLRTVVRQTLDLLRPLARKGNTTLSFAEEDAPCIVFADTGLMQQVLTNLIINAVHATRSGGLVEVGLRQEYAEPPADRGYPAGEYIHLYVRDTGEGIPEENIPHLFEPFFTTKAIGEGTGLGLSVAHGIVRDHGGWIDVRSRVGEGSCLSVFLPLEGASCPDES